MSLRVMRGGFFMNIDINKKEVEIAFMNAMVSYLLQKGLLTIEEASAIREDLESGDILLDKITL